MRLKTLVYAAPGRSQAGQTINNQHTSAAPGINWGSGFLCNGFYAVESGVLTCQSTSHKALSPVWLILVAREPQKSFTVHVIGEEVDCLHQASILYGGQSAASLINFVF